MQPAYNKCVIVKYTSKM